MSESDDTVKEMLDAINAIDDIARGIMDPAIRQPIHAQCERLRLITKYTIRVNL